MFVGICLWKLLRRNGKKASETQHCSPPPPPALQKTQSSNLISVIQLMLRAAAFQEVLLGAIVNEI